MASSTTKPPTFAVLLSGPARFVITDTPDGKILRTWKTRKAAETYANKHGRSGVRVLTLSEATRLIYAHGLTTT